VPQFWLADGTPVVLGPSLARAGEGEIFEVDGRPDLVAKVFHESLTARDVKLAKVAAMVESPPAGAIQADGFVVLAWPEQLLHRDSVGPVGFVMARIDTANAVEIHAVSNPSARAKPLRNAPQWVRHVTWNHLVTVAVNLCQAVEAVHRVDAVVGDLQERNILVSDTCQVSLVDCDSMQFTDPAGRVFPCPVGRPEFTAPELKGIDLRSEPRGKASDNFSLAVHVHLLLMAGNHPFLRGRWTGHGEQPDALALARTGDWAGGPNSRLMTHPLAPPPTFLPSDIRALFVRAFTDGATDPAARPSADEWRRALLRVKVIPCRRNQHQIPIDCTVCPWCAIAAERSARKARTAPPLPQQVIHQVTETPPQKRPRRRTRVYVSVGAAVVGVVAIVSALLIQSQPEPATATVSQAQLGGLLLAPTQLEAAVATAGITLDHNVYAMPADNSVADVACRPLNGAVLAGPYADSGWTAFRNQVLQDPGTSGASFGHRVDQGVVLFPSSHDADAFFSSSAQSWPACSNRSYTTSHAGQPDQQWSVGPISNANGTLSYHNTTPGGDVWAYTTCQRALTAASNVIVDVQVCSTDRSDSDSDAAVTVAREIAARVPNAEDS
jgi:hypothetical protein